jgi:hypothetical protein
VTDTINEAALGPKRKFTATVAFPQSRVTTARSDEVDFVTGPGGTPGTPGPPGPQGEWTKMTQADYDALPNKDPNVLYVIIG